jgi:hypothetical protein
MWKYKQTNKQTYIILFNKHYDLENAYIQDATIICFFVI